MIETIRMQFSCVTSNRERLKKDLARMVGEMNAEGRKKEFLVRLGRGPYSRCVLMVRACERRLKDKNLLQKEEYSLGLPLPGASLNVVRLQADSRTLPELGGALTELNAALCAALTALYAEYYLMRKENE